MRCRADADAEENIDLGKDRRISLSKGIVRAGMKLQSAEAHYHCLGIQAARVAAVPDM